MQSPDAACPCRRDSLQSITMHALELVRAHVNKIPPDATMRDMVDILDLYQVLLIPVVDEDDRLLGTVYEEQIVGATLGDDPGALPGRDDRARMRERAHRLRACDLMVPASFAVDEHDDVLDVWAEMDRSGLARLPVTSNGRVVGTISRVDICQAFLEGDL